MRACRNQILSNWFAREVGSLSRLAEGGILKMVKRQGMVIVVAVTTLVGILVLPAAPAGATTPAWTIQSTPNPAGAKSSLLSGVSCTSATACTAVGAPFHNPPPP